MFEQKYEPLLPRAAFLTRLARSFGVCLLITALSLLMGSAGYHYFAGLSWIDALLNASMILTGMGPVSAMTTTSGKLFATFYALYSGIAFLTMMAIVLAPLQHRLLHRFHVEGEKDDDSAAD
jgi:hypothetical protein